MEPNSITQNQMGKDEQALSSISSQCKTKSSPLRLQLRQCPKRPQLYRAIKVDFQHIITVYFSVSLHALVRGLRVGKVVDEMFV